MRGLVGGGIRPIGVDHVSEGHVADAEACRTCRDWTREIVVNHVAAFDAHERRRFCRRHGRGGLRRRWCEDDIFRIFARRCGARRRFDPVARFTASGPVTVPAIQIEKKIALKSAFAHARNVDDAVGVANAEVEFRVEEALGGVVVGIHDDGAEMEVVSLRGDIGLRSAVTVQQKSLPTTRAKDQRTRLDHSSPSSHPDGILRYGAKKPNVDSHRNA